MNERRFLDLKSYRQKRIVDAARLVPILGALAVLLPLPFLFLGGPADAVGGPDATALAVYFFVVWLTLILVALILSRAFRPPPPPET